MLVAVISCFVSYLGAQTTETKTTTTTTATSGTVDLSGTLVDQGCYTTHTQERQRQHYHDNFYSGDGLSDDDQPDVFRDVHI